MFQKTYTTWIDGGQNEAEISKLKANLKPRIDIALNDQTT